MCLYELFSKGADPQNWSNFALVWTRNKKPDRFPMKMIIPNYFLNLLFKILVINYVDYYAKSDNGFQ